MAKTNPHKLIQPYVSVPYIPLNEVDQTERNGAQFFRNVKELSVGYGAEVFRVDRNGMWAGAETFATAPWSVDWNGNMIASSITLSGYIPTGDALDDIGIGGIGAAYINVSSLSAISANIGSVTSGTVTGALVRTSSSGTRVQMNNSTNSLQVYSGSTKRVELDTDEIIFYDSSGNERGGLYASATTSLYLHALNGGNLILEAEGSAYTVLFNINGTQKGYFSTAGLTLNDDLNLDSNDIIDLRRLNFVASTTNPSANGQMRYYVNGGNEGLRMQFGGSDFQFDASGV